VYDEIVGLGCFRRSGNTGYLRFRWDAVGKVSGASFYYQIYDCTAKKAAATWYLNYPTTSPSTYGVAANKSLKLLSTHRYVGQITGGGSYRRAQSGPFEGIRGYFRTPSGARSMNLPVWFGRTACH
jgi:hypothetical protein